MSEAICPRCDGIHEFEWVYEAFIDEETEEKTPIWREKHAPKMKQLMLNIKPYFYWNACGFCGFWWDWEEWDEHLRRVKIDG